MNRHVLQVKIVLLAVFSIALLVLSRFFCNISELTPDMPMQCAHWCVYRCCQILGVPIDRGFLTEELPFHKVGHSLRQVSDTLNKIGFETSGRRETLDTLEKCSFPCIVHLTDPEHFVVVLAIGDKDVHLFDGDGLRTTWKREVFKKRWSGNVLFIRRPSSKVRLPLFLPKLDGNVPLIQFDSLINDLGTVPAVGEPVTFHFKLQNLGASDLIIEKILPDCSCIESKATEKVIKPGQSGEIELTYHVQPRKGAFYHQVVVQTNDPQLPLISLAASGWSGVEMKVQPLRILLCDAVADYEKKIVCFVKYTGEKQELQVDAKAVDLKNAVLVQQRQLPIEGDAVKKFFPEMLNQQWKYDNIHLFELTFLPTGNPGEVIDGKIILSTNIEGYEKFTLEVMGEICSPLRVFPESFELTQSGFVEISMISRIEQAYEIKRVRCGNTELFWKNLSNVHPEKKLLLDLREIGTTNPLEPLIEIEVQFSNRSAVDVVDVKIMNFK